MAPCEFSAQGDLKSAAAVSLIGLRPDRSVQASDLNAGLFGLSAIPEIPGRAAALFFHRAVLACSPFSRRGVQPSAALRLVEPTAASEPRSLKITRQIRQSAVANWQEALNS